MRKRSSRFFRHLSRRFHRSSSNYSIRSDFPAPPHGTERRWLSRDSADICPSSGDESPVCNTPVHGVRSFMDPQDVFGSILEEAEPAEGLGSCGRGCPLEDWLASVNIVCRHRHLSFRGILEYKYPSASIPTSALGRNLMSSVKVHSPVIPMVSLLSSCRSISRIYAGLISPTQPRFQSCCLERYSR